MAKRTGALLVITTLALGGCADVTRLGYSDERTETATVAAIALSSRSGSVTVKRGTGPGTRIERTFTYRGSKGRPTSDDRVEGDQLLLDDHCGRECTVSFVVTVPTEVDIMGSLGSGQVDLQAVGAVNLDLESGGLTIHGATGTVTAQSRSGAIEIEDAKGNVTATTMSGSVRIHRCGGLVTGTSQSGSVDVREARGDTVTAGSTSGEVTVTLSRPQTIHAQTRSGDIRISVPPGMNVNVHTETRSGGSTIKVPVVNDAPTVLNLTTASGDITVVNV